MVNIRETVILLVLLLTTLGSRAQGTTAAERVTLALWNDTTRKACIHVFPADKTNNSHKAIVLCPGGGYARLSMNNEGYDWVPYFRDMGYTTVVLQYSMPHGNPLIPVGDAEQAMRTVRANASRWDYDANRVGIMGFSAGGHLASTITVSQDPAVRPDFAVLFYPVITMSEDFMHRRSHNELLGEDAPEELNRLYSAEQHVTELTPPTFLALSSDDRTVYPLNAIRFYEALLRQNRPAALHIYPSGRHGWGFRDTFAFHQQVINELRAWLAQTTSSQ